MKTEKLNNKTHIESTRKNKDEQPHDRTETTFTPRRFSVRGLRKHVGVKTSRTPRVAF